MAINCLKKLLFKFGFVEVGFSFCFLLFSSSNTGAGTRQTSGGKTSRQDRQLSTVFGFLSHVGVKYMPSFDGRVGFRVLVGNLFVRGF